MYSRTTKTTLDGGKIGILLCWYVRLDVWEWYLEYLIVLVFIRCRLFCSHYHSHQHSALLSLHSIQWRVKYFLTKPSMKNLLFSGELINVIYFYFPQQEFLRLGILFKSDALMKWCKDKRVLKSFETHFQLLLLFRSSEFYINIFSHFTTENFLLYSLLITTSKNKIIQSLKKNSNEKLSFLICVRKSWSD